MRYTQEALSQSLLEGYGSLTVSNPCRQEQVYKHGIYTNEEGCGYLVSSLYSSLRIQVSSSARLHRVSTSLKNARFSEEFVTI